MPTKDMYILRRFSICLSDINIIAVDCILLKRCFLPLTEGKPFHLNPPDFFEQVSMSNGQAAPDYEEKDHRKEKRDRESGESQPDD